jgi:hypothetical protein
MSGFDFPDNIDFNVIKSFSFSTDVFLLLSGAFIYTVVVSAVSAEAVAETTTTKTTNNINNRNMTVAWNYIKCVIITLCRGQCFIDKIRVHCFIRVVIIL